MEEVRAPVAGNIWKLECKEGEAIALDDVVLILEAMKMEVEVYAPVSGTVAQISAKEGQAVAEGDLLLTIQP